MGTKNTNTTVSIRTSETEKLMRLRESKKLASQRCRARAKLRAAGELIPAELALRSLQPHALNVDNFKYEVGDVKVRLNRNGGEKVALSVTMDGETTRKSYKNIQEAAKAFQEKLKELQD